MTASEEKVQNVSAMLEKFDGGMRKYLDWISNVKHIDKKVTNKADNKTDLESWRMAFSEVAKKTGIEVVVSNDNSVELKFLSFSINVHFDNKTSIDSVSLSHPAVGETALDILRLIKSPREVPGVFATYSEILKAMIEASREDSTELSKVVTGMTSIYGDLRNDSIQQDEQFSCEKTLSSRFGCILGGRSCFLRPQFVYYCFPTMVSRPVIFLENRAYITFVQTVPSLTLQVAHNNISDVFTYSSVSGVYMLMLDKPVLFSFVIYRKLQDLCRNAGILEYLKTTNEETLKSLRESTQIFPKALLKSSSSVRIMQDVPNYNLKLAISVQFDKNFCADVLDPCQWVQAIPFCDTKSLANIIYLLRLQQRFNSLILNSCEQSDKSPGSSNVSSNQSMCLPLNINVNSLMSFIVKFRHPIEPKFLIANVSFSRTNDWKFNEPKITLCDLSSLLSDNSEEGQTTYLNSLRDTFKDSWSLSALGAFIWQSFLPPFLSCSIAKEERNFGNEVNNIQQNSPVVSSEVVGSSSSNVKCSRRVSILDEILDEPESAANANGCLTSDNVSPSRLRLINSNSWLPNSSNISSFEPLPPMLNAAPSRPVTAHGQRGRPRKNPLHINASGIPGPAGPPSAKSPAGSSKKRQSLPPVTEMGDPEMSSGTSLSASKLPKQPSKRGRRVSTSPSTSSPAFPMQPSPAGSRHGDFLPFHQPTPGGQTPNSTAMTPGFNYPSDYGGTEESIESCIPSTPSDEKYIQMSTATECHPDPPVPYRTEQFPSPPVLIPEETPGRPGSEEEEKGLIICEPGGVDSSPFDNYGHRNSRPSSSMSSDQMRMGRGHQRVLLSSDDSEQSSNTSLSDDRMKTEFNKQDQPPRSGSANLGKSTKPGTKMLNDIFDLGGIAGADGNAQLSRNQRMAALDRVLMKNQQDVDVVPFQDKDHVPSVADLKMMSRPGKRPAPPANSSVAKPKSTNQAVKKDEQRYKMSKQRKLDEATGDAIKKDKKQEVTVAAKAALPDFTRPLPANMKIPKKTPGATPAGLDGAPNASKPASKPSPSHQTNSAHQNPNPSVSALGSFRIPKKKDTSESMSNSNKDSSKRPSNSPVIPNSNSSQQQSSTTKSASNGSSGSYRQRTNSFDGPKEKNPPNVLPGNLPEPPLIPLSASFPQSQKAAEQPSSASRSLQHHKSQQEFMSSEAERRKNALPPDVSRSNNSSSSVRRGSSHNSSRSSSSTSQSISSRSSSNQQSGQRPSGYDSAARRQTSVGQAPPSGSYQSAGSSSASNDSYQNPSGSYPQPPPAHQRFPTNAHMNSSKSFPAHSSSSSSSNYQGEYSNNFANSGNAGSSSGGASWYDNTSSLGGSNYRSFFDQPPGDAQIQSPEPYGQQNFERQAPVIIATSPVRIQPPPSSSNSGGNFF